MLLSLMKGYGIELVAEGLRIDLSLRVDGRAVAGNTLRLAGRTGTVRVVASLG